MPGIYGAVALGPDRDPSDVADAIRDLITHQPWYRSCADRRDGRVIGAVSTNPGFDVGNHFANDGDVRLLIEGTALTIDGNPVPDSAPDFARRLLELYLAEGDDFIKRVTGHFGLVIDDARDGRLILLNDHLAFGQMYWYLDDDVFLFGPEMKMCLAWHKVDLTVDMASVATFLAQECPFGESTLLQRTKFMLEGSKIVLQDGKVTRGRYWFPTYEVQEGRSRTDFADEAIALYERSVAKRVPTDSDRVVVALSGGLDSRLLLNMAHKCSGNLQLFTHGQSDCDEYKIAQQVARTLGLEDRHELIEIRPEWYGEHARRAVWLNDGMCNCRNAGLIGVSEQVGPGAAPFLNGILGPYLSIGTGHYIKPDDWRESDDDDDLRQVVFNFTGVSRGAKAFDTYMRPDTSREMGALAQDQIWSSFQDYRELPRVGNKKMFHQIMNMGRRMQSSVDVHKFFFHDLIPMIDSDLFELYQRIPLEEKEHNPIYMDMYRRHLTDLARVPWSRTGFDLFADPKDIERKVERRMKRFKLNSYIRRLSFGHINPRDRYSYTHREAWLRKNRIFREEITGVLADVKSVGCDFMEQSMVDWLLADFNKGKDWHFHTLMQIYTTLVWHEQFLRSAPGGRDLRPLGD